MGPVSARPLPPRFHLPGVQQRSCGAQDLRWCRCHNGRLTQDQHELSVREPRPIRARRDGSLRQGRPVSVHLRNDAGSRFRSHRRHPGAMRYHRHLSEDDALRQRQRAVGCTRISRHDRSTWPERRTDSGQRSDLPMGQHTAQPVGFHRVRDDRRARGQT